MANLWKWLHFMEIQRCKGRTAKTGDLPFLTLHFLCDGMESISGASGYTP